MRPKLSSGWVALGRDGARQITKLTSRYLASTSRLFFDEIKCQIYNTIIFRAKGIVKFENWQLYSITKIPISAHFTSLQPAGLAKAYLVPRTLSSRLSDRKWSRPTLFSTYLAEPSVYRSFGRIRSFVGTLWFPIWKTRVTSRKSYWICRQYYSFYNLLEIPLSLNMI